MQATLEKQIGVIRTQLEPIVGQLFQGRACAVLVERDQGGVINVNPGDDLGAGGDRARRQDSGP